MNQKTNEIREFILTQIESHPQDITAATAQKFAISKQAVRKHLQALEDEGLVVASGATRDRLYTLGVLDEFIHGVPIDASISEDVLWRQQILPRLADIPSNVLKICQYGFTEMVNNAIDHSEGKQLMLRLRRTAALIEILIYDDGIGIFNKLSKFLGLDDPIYVILELAKGKLTTDPKHHTGEGIYYTSRMFDHFMLASEKIAFIHKGINDDWLREENEELFQGTAVRLQINPKSKRTLEEIFDLYAGEMDYGFSKTHVPVTLARYGDENLLSRSQAKRLYARFERFKEIVLDFKDVESIGQAFADELLRVFPADHPEIHLTCQNANEQVQKMISRVTSTTGEI